MKITTIITSHDRFKDLKEAVESVLTQTYTNWQLIIIDDTKIGFSKDNIEVYVTDLAKKDSRVEYISCKPQSENSCPYGIKINMALKRAKGALISYLCDDDYYGPMHFQTCIDTFQKYPEANIVYTGQMVMSYVDQTNYFVRKAELIRSCGFFTVDHIAVMHKKEIIDIVGGWTEDQLYRKYGDAEFFLRAARAGFKMYPTREITCIKRVKTDGLNSI